MRIVCLLLVFSALCLRAQTPEELLQLTEQSYKSTAGYEITGSLEVLLPGSATPLHGDISVAALPESLRQGPFHWPAVMPQLHPEPGQKVSIMLPVEVFAGFSDMTRNVASVTEVGAEQLPLNGTPVACRVLLVHYKPHPYLEGHNPPVTYSICSDKHLVLKKTVATPADRKGEEPPAQWTLTFTSARFGVAADWLMNLHPAAALSTRREWLGQPAPDFTLTRLDDGKPARLSRMRGKVVLLDFWAINCAPCIHSLPTMQAVEGAYRAKKVVVWTVALDRPEMSRKWLLTHTDSSPILNDPDFAASDLYKTQGIPAVVLVGRDGKVKNYWQGEVPQQELEAALEAALHS